jgi:hypothetical protein
VRLALTFFAALLLATACKREEVSGDAKMQKMLAGVWTADLEIGGISDVTVAQDGRYFCTLTVPGRTNEPRIFNSEGTFRVHEGNLIDTMTRYNRTNRSVPLTNRAQIVRLDRHELVLAYDPTLGASGPTNPVVFRRLTK